MCDALFTESLVLSDRTAHSGTFTRVDKSFRPGTSCDVSKYRISLSLCNSNLERPCGHSLVLAWSWRHLDAGSSAIGTPASFLVRHSMEHSAGLYAFLAAALERTALSLLVHARSP